MLSQIVAPAAPALTLAQARMQLKVPDSQHDEDPLLADVFIPAITERGESATRRQFIRATWTLTRRAFPWEYWIEIPKPPLIDLVSITYVDSAGVTQTFDSANYIVEKPVGPRCARGRVSLVYGAIWPLTRPQAAAVTLTFKAGYGDDDSAIPSLLKVGMLMDLGTLWANREAVITDGAKVVEIPSGTVPIYRAHKSYAAQR